MPTTTTTRITRQTRQPSIDAVDMDEPSSSNAPASEAVTMEADDLEQDPVENSVNNTWTLYERLMSETIPITELATNWFSSYEEQPTSALAELINILIRASKCTGSINGEQLDEHDRIPSILENLQTEFDNTGKADYPFAGRDKPSRVLRANIVHYFEQIISDAGDAQLWDGQLVSVLTAWITCMSSSQFRPFRHTATVVALAIAGALCFIGQRTTTTLRTLRQQLETEQKKSRPNAQRVTSIRTQVESLASRQGACDEMLDHLFDGIFVHRYRDIDPAIRVDCVSFLGDWVIRYPDRFVDNQYIRYLGWSMTDNMPHPRIATLRALIKLHRDRALNTVITPLTERYKPQLLQLATREKDINVRVPAIQLAVIFGKQGAWETDEERNELCRLIVHPQPRIQKAIAPLCAQMIKEEFIEPALDEAKHDASHQTATINESWIAWKAFAAFCLQHFGDAILTVAANTHKTSIIDNIVAALWNDISVIKEWRALADLLAMDHSVAITTGKKSKRRQSSMGHTGAQQPSYHTLNEQEEAILLNILPASIRLLVTPNEKGLTRRSTKQEASTDEIHKDISIYLMSILPNLFAKYGPDANRVVALLAIVRLLDFGNYLTLNQPAELADLLEQVARAFLNFDHTMSSVTSAAAETLRAMRICAPVAQQTSMKLLEIRDMILEPFWTTCADKIQSLNSLSANEQSVISTVVTRIEILLRYLDVADILNECRKNETIAQLLGKLMGMLSMDRVDDVKLMESTLNLHYRAILWMIREQYEMVPETFGRSTSGNVDHYMELAKCSLEQCTRIINNITSNSSELKQRAFNIGCQLYWMIFVNQNTANNNNNNNNNNNSNRILETSVIPCPVEVQRIYSQFIEQLIEQHGDVLYESMGTYSEDDDDDEDDDDRATRGKSRGVVNKNSDNRPEDDHAEHTLLIMLGSFARCIISGAFDPSRATQILASYGRFSGAFDELVRNIIEKTSMSTEVVSKSLKESFDHVTFKRLPSLESTLGLARLLVDNCSGTSLVDLHCDGITFVISKMAGYTRVGNTRIKMDMLRYFRVLSILAKYIQPVEANEILTFLETTCNEHNVHPNNRAKSWDPYTAYTKLLATIKDRPTTTTTTATTMMMDENRILDSPLLAMNKQRHSHAMQSAMVDEHEQMEDDMNQLDMLAHDLRQMPVDGNNALSTSMHTPPRQHAVRHRDISQQLDTDVHNTSVLDDTPTLRGKKRDFTASLISTNSDDSAADNENGSNDGNNDQMEQSSGNENVISDTNESNGSLNTRPKRIRGNRH
ncbi:hypothetical protein BDF22DRAFT_686466 [Syncephalis plumigaleata]|nr:hypothetical protein BDF22DRAFT_686466 [Syncephalis plumigaleata]